MEEKEKPRSVDKNIELLKVQIVSDNIHSRHTVLVPTVFAVFIGFFAVFYTLYYENLLPLVGLVVGMVVLAAGAAYELYDFRKNFRKDMKRVSDMIESVKGGKELPTLEELLKMKANRN